MDNDKEVRQKLQIIQHKVREIEESHIEEVRGLQKRIEVLTQDFETLKRKAASFEKSNASLSESLAQSVADHKSAQAELEKAECLCMIVSKERDQLQSSLAHMEGLLVTSRNTSRGSDAALRETQQNFEIIVAELESKLQGKQTELVKSNAATAKMQKSIDALKMVISDKEREIELLQETVRRECVERTTLLMRAGTLSVPLTNQQTVTTKSAELKSSMLLEGQQQELPGFGFEDINNINWQKIKNRRKR